MSYNYFATAHKGTVVTSSITGTFTGPDDLNLIQAKGSNLVISLVTAEGLKTIVDVDIFGRIVSIHLFRPKVCINGSCCHVLHFSIPFLRMSLRISYSF